MIATFKSGLHNEIISHKSRYLIGADGGRSSVRKAWGINFQGFSWTDYIVITAKIEYDSKRMAPFGHTNFVADPELWGVVIELSPGNWRITFPVRIDKCHKFDWRHEEIVDCSRLTLPKILPDPVGELSITAVAAYKMHQLCAETFVDRNVILAGDAAHVSFLAFPIFYVWLRSNRDHVAELFLSDI